MTLLPNRDTPSVCFVAPDADQAWQEIGAHLLHDARMYSEWNPDNENSAGIAHVSDVGELRAMSRTASIVPMASWVYTRAARRTSTRAWGNLAPAPSVSSSSDSLPVTVGNSLSSSAARSSASSRRCFAMRSW